MLLVWVALAVIVALNVRHSWQPVTSGVPVEVVGNVPYPGWYRVADGGTAGQAVGLAGGISTMDVLVARGDRVRILADGTVRTERGAPLLSGNRVDLNRDDRQALMHLPGIGASVAARLFDAAALQGPADVLAVRGIGGTVFDGLHPLVWTPSPPPKVVAPPLNFNTAPSSQLVELPGVGPVLADRIVAARSTVGPYTSARDLQRVHGIGPTRAMRLAAVGVFE